MIVVVLFSPSRNAASSADISRLASIVPVTVIWAESGGVVDEINDSLFLHASTSSFIFKIFFLDG